jgi:hypothetical protein
LVVRQDGSFFEAVHAFADLDIAVSLGVKESFGEAVFLDDFGGEVPAMYSHVLVDFHGGAEEKIFYVTRAVAGAAGRIGDDTVDVQFGVGYADCRGTHILVSVEAIATYCHTDAVDFGFSWAHGTDVSSVSDFAPCRDLSGLDEEHGVVALDPLTGRSVLADALHAATPFVGERARPDVGVGALEEGVHCFVASCDGVLHLAGDGWIVVLGRLGEEGRNPAMSAGVEVETGEACPGTLPVLERWLVKCNLGGG